MSAVLLVSALDGLCKYFIHSDVVLSFGPLFSIRLFKNPGVAFSLPVPLWLALIVTALVTLLLATFLARQPRWDHPRHISAFMMLIGAGNNAIDRILNGYTTDYLIFLNRLAINLSDLLIIIGALGFLWYDEVNRKDA